MAKQTLNTIKDWFNTGFKPLQQQFRDTFDSFWHKDEVIPAANIENLDIRFGEKADNDNFARHISDLNTHELDQKAGLADRNTFLKENTFVKQVRIPGLLTDAGLELNPDRDNNEVVKGFSGELFFDTEDGTLSYSSVSRDSGGVSREIFSGAKFSIKPSGDLDVSGLLNASVISLSANDGFEQHIQPAAVVTTEDTELSLPQLSGILARKEDIPAISAGNNITITGTLLKPVINATVGGGNLTESSGNFITEVTYEELNALIHTESLVPGKEYCISDFQSTFVYAEHKIADNPIPSESLYYGSEVYSGPVEPLIVLAITPAKIHAVVRSANFPADEIVYTTQNLYRGILASTKGTILRRTDMMLNNTANFDYRRTKFRTNGGEPQDALYLSSNCTVEALGDYGTVTPVVIMEMENSVLYSFSGDIMRTLRDSNLQMLTGRIYSISANVYKCNIKGELIYIDRNYTDTRFSLNYVYARIGQVNSSLQNDRVLQYLANQQQPSVVVEASDRRLYLQKIDNTGLVITERLSYSAV
ncbi:hypothetical protein TH53_17920 [Pedobacter lusitanus]|uniref:Uncharacterized protein n=1 Tax=Pedobacter lusitanus TaxID=1503925 RepID=A0A0D0FU28_9SPHI|nr:hypothetical protein [Pedobacter lusitanus]KIO75939.1 hypothetical protein TH53_17920 [Pedobacter lusitanus]